MNTSFNQLVVDHQPGGSAQRTPRPRLSPAGFVRCASSDPSAQKDLRRMCTTLVQHQAGGLQVVTAVAERESSVVPVAELETPVMAVAVPVSMVAPEPLDKNKRERGRPSKIAVASRARLFGPEDEVVPVSVVKTTNYDQFIIPTGVAEPTEEEVERFVQRVSLSNELLWHPIRVTPYLEVYDGKLRLAAARRLGVALAYLVDEQLTVGDIIADRGEPRGWEFDQYCLYYAEQGRSEYARVLQFAKEQDLPLGSAISFLSGGGTKATEEVLAAFKRGRFHITHLQHALTVVRVRNEYRRKMPPAAGAKPKKDITTQRVFLNAVSTHLAQPGVRDQDLLGILTNIRWQPTEADYQRHMGRLLREAHTGRKAVLTA